MKHKFIIFYLFIIICSCAKTDSVNISCELDIIPPTGNNPDRISMGKTLDQGSLFNECVSIENITSTSNDFIMLDKGFQQEGSAKGIKINKVWDASVFVNIYDSVFNLSILTYWHDTLDNSFLTGDALGFAHIPTNNDNPLGCYNLTSEVSSDSNFVRCYFSIKHGDITLVNYTLDESKENKFEILEYDPINGIVKGKLKASFITDEPEPGYFPEQVRFFNVDFETY